MKACTVVLITLRTSHAMPDPHLHVNPPQDGVPTPMPKTFLSYKTCPKHSTFPPQIAVSSLLSGPLRKTPYHGCNLIPVNPLRHHLSIWRSILPKPRICISKEYFSEAFYRTSTMLSQIHCNTPARRHSTACLILSLSTTVSMATTVFSPIVGGLAEQSQQ